MVGWRLAVGCETAGVRSGCCGESRAGVDVVWSSGLALIGGCVREGWAVLWG